MEAEDLIVGNKYVPHRKSVKGYEGLESSTVWERRRGKKQGFLYYTGCENGVYSFDSEFIENEMTGDFFNPSDVNPYEGFILPENWCIKITDENYSVLKEYWLKQPYDHDLGFLGYLLSEGSWDNSGLNYASNISIATSNKYILITFEQFKTYILNTNKVMSKKLIGYNLKPEFENMQNAASYIAFLNGGWTKENPQFSIGDKDDQIIRLSQANVLDLWFDKVYKKENRKETYHLGDKAILVTFKEDGIFADGKEWFIDTFEKMINGRQLYNYDITITEIKIGCTTVKVEELRDLIAKAKKFYGK